MSYQRQSTTSLRDLVPGASSRPLSTSLLLGQVFFLVSVAIGFLALGAYVGRNVSFRTAEICEFGAIALILAQSFGGRTLRTGSVGMALLFGLALLLGIGLAPVIAHYSSGVNHGVLERAAGGTALTVAAMGSFGYATSRDLVRWVRPLFWAFLAAIAASWVLVLVGSGGNVVLELVIYALSAAYLAIYFQIIRRGAGEDDVVWIATGVFVSIVNVFITLLNIFGNNR